MAIDLQVPTGISQNVQQVADDDGNQSALGLSTSALVVSSDFSMVEDTQQPSSAYVYGYQTSGMYFYIEPDFIWPGSVTMGVTSPSGYENPLRIDAGQILLQSRSGGPVLLPNLQSIASAPPNANLESVFVDTNTGQLYYE